MNRFMAVQEGINTTQAVVIQTLPVGLCRIDWTQPPINGDSDMKTITEEIQYLGLMLTATGKEDVSRIKAIINRLTELVA